MITIGEYLCQCLHSLGVNHVWEHLTYAMSINTYRCQQLENLQLDHKEK